MPDHMKAPKLVSTFLQDLSGFASKAYRAKPQEARQRSDSLNPSPSRSEPGPLKRGPSGLSAISSGGPDLSLGRRGATFQDVTLEEDGQVILLRSRINDFFLR